MKKLFSVVILAALPVACGSTIPSGPDAAQPVGSADSTVTTQRIVRTVPTPGPTCVANGIPAGIDVSVVGGGPGYAILRAEAVNINSDVQNSCFTPVWTLSVKAGKAHLEPVKDRQQIMLVGPAGQYLVTVKTDTAGSDVRGSLLVDIK